MLCQCNVSKSKFSQIEEEFSHISDISKLKAVVIIPSQGCDGCITTVESFLMEKSPALGKKGILFIITGHNSVKSAVLRLGGFIKSNDNIYIDTKHQFDTRLFINEYPKVFFFESGRIRKSEDLSPSTSDVVYKELNNIN